jgi:predicted  nucleic acid-binding Zn-ribbon protein
MQGAFGFGRAPQDTSGEHGGPVELFCKKCAKTPPPPGTMCEDCGYRGKRPRPEDTPSDSDDKDDQVDSKKARAVAADEVVARALQATLKAEMEAMKEQVKSLADGTKGGAPDVAPPTLGKGKKPLGLTASLNKKQMAVISLCLADYLDIDAPITWVELRKEIETNTKDIIQEMVEALGGKKKRTGTIAKGLLATEVEQGIKAKAK